MRTAGLLAGVFPGYKSPWEFSLSRGGFWLLVAEKKVHGIVTGLEMMVVGNLEI